MTWLLYTLIAIVAWAISDLLDKHVMSRETRDPILVTTVFGMVACLIFLAVAVVFGGSVLVSLPTIGAALAAGLCYSLALFLYYKVMRSEELSSFVTILATEPLVVALLAMVFFAEKLSWFGYLGIFAICAGAVLISHKKNENKVEKHLHVLAFGSMAAFAGRNLFMRFATGQTEYFTAIFWFAFGGLIIPLIFLIFHHPHLRAKAKQSIRHVAVSAIFSALGLLCFMKAISTGTVALPSALLATKPLLIFALVTILSFFHSKFISEPLRGQVLIKKIVAIVLIMVGSFLITW
jgi:uncharacterized membrane protein